MARDTFGSAHGEADDSIVARLMELKSASAGARPLPGFARRIAAKLEERSVRNQLAVALMTAALAASVSLAFWWDANSRLTFATVTTAAVDEAEGLEP